MGSVYDDVFRHLESPLAQQSALQRNRAHQQAALGGAFGSLGQKGSAGLFGGGVGFSDFDRESYARQQLAFCRLSPLFFK